METPKQHKQQNKDQSKQLKQDCIKTRFQLLYYDEICSIGHSFRRNIKDNVLPTDLNKNRNISGFMKQNAVYFCNEANLPKASGSMIEVDIGGNLRRRSSVLDELYSSPSRDEAKSKNAPWITMASTPTRKNKSSRKDLNRLNILTSEQTESHTQNNIDQSPIYAVDQEFKSFDIDQYAEVPQLRKNKSQPKTNKSSVKLPKQSALAEFAVQNSVNLNGRELLTKVRAGSFHFSSSKFLNISHNANWTSFNTQLSTDRLEPNSASIISKDQRLQSQNRLAPYTPMDAFKKRQQSFKVDRQQLPHSASFRELPPTQAKSIDGTSAYGDVSNCRVKRKFDSKSDSDSDFDDKQTFLNFRDNSRLDIGGQKMKAARRMLQEDIKKKSITTDVSSGALESFRNPDETRNTSNPQTVSKNTSQISQGSPQKNPGPQRMVSCRDIGKLNLQHRTLNSYRNIALIRPLKVSKPIIHESCIEEQFLNEKIATFAENDNQTSQTGNEMLSGSGPVSPLLSKRSLQSKIDSLNLATWQKEEEASGDQCRYKQWCVLKDLANITKLFYSQYFTEEDGLEAPQSQNNFSCVVSQRISDSSEESRSERKQANESSLKSNSVSSKSDESGTKTYGLIPRTYSSFGRNWVLQESDSIEQSTDPNELRVASSSSNDTYPKRRNSDLTGNDQKRKTLSSHIYQKLEEKFSTPDRISECHETLSSEVESLINDSSQSSLKDEPAAPYKQPKMTSHFGADLSSVIRKTLDMKTNSNNFEKVKMANRSHSESLAQSINISEENSFSSSSFDNQYVSNDNNVSSDQASVVEGSKCKAELSKLLQMESSRILMDLVNNNKTNDHNNNYQFQDVISQQSSNSSQETSNILQIQTFMRKQRSQMTLMQHIVNNDGALQKQPDADTEFTFEDKHHSKTKHSPGHSRSSSNYMDFQIKMGTVSRRQEIETESYGSFIKSPHFQSLREKESPFTNDEFSPNLLKETEFDQLKYAIPNIIKVLLRQNSADITEDFLQADILNDAILQIKQSKSGQRVQERQASSQSLVSNQTMESYEMKIEDSESCRSSPPASPKRMSEQTIKEKKVKKSKFGQTNQELEDFESESDDHEEPTSQTLGIAAKFEAERTMIKKNSRLRNARDSLKKHNSSSSSKSSKSMSKSSKCSSQQDLQRFKIENPLENLDVQRNPESMKIIPAIYNNLVNQCDLSPCKEVPETPQEEKTESDDEFKVEDTDSESDLQLTANLTVQPQINEELQIEESKEPKTKSSTKSVPIDIEENKSELSQIEQQRLRIQSQRSCSYNSTSRRMVTNNESLDPQLDMHNIQEFYNDLSSDSDSTMQDKLDKLKDLFKTQKLDKYVTVTSPRTMTRLGSLGSNTERMSSLNQYNTSQDQVTGARITFQINMSAYENFRTSSGYSNSSKSPKNKYAFKSPKLFSGQMPEMMLFNKGNNTMQPPSRQYSPCTTDRQRITSTQQLPLPNELLTDSSLTLVSQNSTQQMYRTCRNNNMPAGPPSRIPSFHHRVESSPFNQDAESPVQLRMRSRNTETPARMNTLTEEIQSGETEEELNEVLELYRNYKDKSRSESMTETQRIRTRQAQERQNRDNSNDQQHEERKRAPQKPKARFTDKSTHKK